LVAAPGFAAFAAVGVGFFAVCAGFLGDLVVAEEAALSGAVVEPPFAGAPVDCPPTGSATISMESRPDRLRVASRETQVGEDATLISSL
jgi:hypothetical protein